VYFILYFGLAFSAYEALLSSASDQWQFPW